MQNRKSKLAFSLIELSVVILIIGILVIGISKGSRIISSSRLTSAKALTTSSPVNLLSSDLAMWFDTTSTKSFDPADAVDGTAVTNWYDLNPSGTTDPFHLSSSTTQKPLYIASATNGLPALRFDGINDTMIRASVLGNAFTKDGNQITVFFVSKHYLVPASPSAIIWWNNSGQNKFTMEAINSDNGNLYADLGVCCNADARLTFTPSNFNNRTNIITFVRRSNSFGAVRVNGTQYVSSPSLTSVMAFSPAATFSISAAATGNAEKADMNEIIIFKIGLKDSEIAEIEKYLSNKWGVALKGL